MAQGFLTIEETILLAERGLTIMDPFSTLVSKQARLSSGIFVWPNVTIIAGKRVDVSIGSGTVLHSGVRVEAVAGPINVGADRDIGQQCGFTLLTAGNDDAITIGNGARLNGGGSIAINSKIGDGAQILGPIRVQHCLLGAGGSHKEPDPDRRGGVLKGAGVARDLEIPTGMVIQAFGIFAEATLRPQTYFHPAAKRS